MMHLNQFLVFCLLIVALHACRCRPPSQREAYGNAEWVRRAKILRRREKIIGGVAYIQYKVNDIEIFKNIRRPRWLSDEITTPRTSAACGVTSLRVGKEYLLSGTFVGHGDPHMNTCGQITAKDKNGQSLGSVLEWNEVPNDLKRRLRKGNV